MSNEIMEVAAIPVTDLKELIGEIRELKNMVFLITGKSGNGDNEYMTPTETAEVLRVQKSTLAHWRCTKLNGPNYTKRGNQILYHRNDVNDFLQKKEVNTEITK